MSKRIIPNLQFNINGDGEPDYSVIAENEIVRDIVYSQTVWGIRDAIKRKSKHAKIVEINSTGQYLTVEKQDFESALNNSISYYEVFEDYETCAEIVKLKNQL
jgi:hypothetical protein